MDRRGWTGRGGKPMPIVYRCQKCGCILDVYARVGQDPYGVRTPSEIAARYGGICPCCGRRLNSRPSFTDITVETNGIEKLLQVLGEALERGEPYARYYIQQNWHMLPNGQHLLEKLRRTEEERLRQLLQKIQNKLQATT